MFKIFGLPYSSNGKESACEAKDLGSVPGLGRPPAEWNGKPLQYFYLENSMDREAWLATVREVVELDTTERLTHNIFLEFHFYFLWYSWIYLLTQLFNASSTIMLYVNNLGHIQCWLFYDFDWSIENVSPFTSPCPLHLLK